jgi:hypothetical protein
LLDPDLGLPFPHREAINRSGSDMNMEAQIDAATWILRQGGPAMQAPIAITNRMHALFGTRAEAFDGCTEGSPGEAELAARTNAIEASEAVP